MYHYVRPISNSRYPNIKGLELSSFINQLEFFSKERCVVSTADVLQAVKGKSELPENAIWLTFDDGYKDHYQFAAPILEKFGFDAAFFPVSNCYDNKTILDVNKIHYILAVMENEDQLLIMMREEMLSEGYSNSDWEHLWARTDKSSRFDTEKVIFFKRLLQRELPLSKREKILKNLFEKLVGRTEADVASELYMTEGELRELHTRGFTIGSHTASHKWLNSISASEQKIEIQDSITALEKIRGTLDDWIMSYPYGAYNNDTIDIISSLNCAFAVTTNLGSANFSTQNRFELSRFDTNDFPK
jgi:peptidoglycan/xylan/chitin deacetylase (PgdA/CDA1 family)